MTNSRENTNISKWELCADGNELDVNGDSILDYGEHSERDINLFLSRKRNNLIGVGRVGPII